jgi:type IV secretory pathway VirB10-like protein
VAWIKKDQVADFFLNEEHVYSKKRTIKLKHVIGVLGILGVLVFLLGSYYDEKAKREFVTSEAKKEVNSATNVPNTNQAISTPPANGYLSLPSSFTKLGAGGNRPGGRDRSATQIIKRGENSSDVLPMGSGIVVELIGKVESTDASSPVQAVVLDDVLSPVLALVIPKGTKAIGNGQVDTNRERLQVRFHTLVFPDGEQFAISGLGIMPDGSSGLAGDFSSGAFKRNASQFIGTFVGGVAEGLKDRSSAGALGIPLEPGGIKNGLLNGVVQSTQSYTNAQTNQMGQTGASIRVRSGTRFVLFLDREFHQ